MSLIFFSSDLIHLLKSRPDIYSLLRVRTCKVSSERSNARRYPPARLDLMTGSVWEVEFVCRCSAAGGSGFLAEHNPVPVRGAYAELAHPPGLVCETLHERSAVPQHFRIELVDALDRDVREVGMVGCLVGRRSASTDEGTRFRWSGKAAFLRRSHNVRTIGTLSG